MIHACSFPGAARAGHGRAIWHYAVLLAGLGAQPSGSDGTPLSKSAADEDSSCIAAGLGAHSNTHPNNALILPTNAARHDPVFGQGGSSRKCAAKASRSDAQALRDAQVTAMYHISAMAGITEAQVALGFRYMVGRTVHPSCETAAWYLGAVAQQSHDEHRRGGAEQVQEMIRLTPDMENAADEGELGGDDERIAYQLLLAEQGNVPAMVNMGDLYYYGARGLARDQAAAFRWFDQAAAAGDANGQVAAAGLLLKGEGVDQNHTAALALYEKAADQNHTRALNGLAYLYFQGTSSAVERNFTRAFELFSRAAAKENDGDSLYNAGHCHQHGQGTTVNVAEAMRMFKIAAEKFGHFDSIFELSRLHLENAPSRVCPTSVLLLRYFFRTVCVSAVYVYECTHRESPLTTTTTLCVQVSYLDEIFAWLRAYMCANTPNARRAFTPFRTPVPHTPTITRCTSYTTGRTVMYSSDSLFEARGSARFVGRHHPSRLQPIHSSGPRRSGTSLP